MKNLSKPLAILFAALLVTTAGASIPVAGASTTISASPTILAHSSDADAESASSMVYKVIKSKYASQVSGRTLETSCSGRKSPFSCKWWIIKKSKERPKHCLTSAAHAISSSSGEGELHTRYCYVYKAGTASATYNAKKRSWVIVG